MVSDDARNPLEIRPFFVADEPFLARIAHRLHPGQTVSPRDPVAFDRFFATMSRGRLLNEPGSEAFVATIDGQPAGLIAMHPDSDYFTGHRRAYIDFLVVAPEAEGSGVGRALMLHAEEWAKVHDCLEVCLDVFADNAGAARFYEKCGFRIDHVRMAKPLL